ncbi:MAG: FAD-binding protein [Deltaproteobacteria bacterium]|nr:FAD-binding protein [Deltaproteobacteria bacterium]
MKAAYEHEIPVTPRGGGTGRVGGAIPVPGGIVLAFEKMNAIEGIDKQELTTRVQPGVILGELKRATEEEQLFYPPDPNSVDSCAIGGNLAANAGGPRAFKYGVTREYAMAMDVVLADGTVLKLGHETKKGVTGYDLTALMVGSEGTLGIVTEATLRLIPKPEATVTALACFSSLDEVAPVVSALLAQGQLPACIELLDEEAIRIVRPEAGLTIPNETSERATSYMTSTRWRYWSHNTVGNASAFGHRAASSATASSARPRTSSRKTSWFLAPR